MNNARYTQYVKEITGLIGDVGSQSFFQLLRDKILDYLSRPRAKSMSVNDLIREMTPLFDSEYQPFVKSVINSWHDSIDVVNDLYEDMGNKIPVDHSRLLALERLNNVDFGNYAESTLKAIAKKSQEVLARGGTLQELRDTIASIDSQAKHYADTLAKTQIKRHSRLAKNEKANLAEVFIYQWVGRIRSTTRPMCYACRGKHFHISQISMMRNGNLEPVLDNAGGWNCIHDLEPDPDATRDDIVKGATKQFGNVLLFADAEMIAKFNLRQLSL